MSSRSSGLEGLILLAVVSTALATGSAASEPPPVAPQADVQRLIPGHSIERRLAGGESHVYRVDGTAGEPWLLKAKQRGIDLALEVFDPTGSSLGTIDGPLGRWDDETYLVQPEMGGLYRIEVRPNASRVATGRYALDLDLRSTQTFARRQRLAAEVAGTSGARRSGEPKADGMREAVAFYRRSQYYWLELGERFEAARAAHAIAELGRRSGELESAIRLFEEVLEEWRALDERGYEAEALNGLGLTHLRLRAYDQARAYLTDALALNRGLGREVEAAGNLMDLALVDQYQGHLRRAQTGYRDAYQLYRQAGHLEYEASLLNNLGGIYSRLGNPVEAMNYFQQSLDLRRAAGNTSSEAAVLNNMAVLHRYLWQPDRALELYSEVLSIARERGDSRRESLIYNNMGYAYLELGELDRAEEYLKRALELRRLHGYQRSEAATLKNLGDLHSRRGDPSAALASHRQALALTREAGHQQDTVALLSIVGRDLVELGELSAARRHFAEALEALGDTDDPIARADVLHRQGETLFLLGEVEVAVSTLESARELRRSIADRDGELETLLALARAERRQGRLSQARQRLAEARSAVESLRVAVSSPELRAAFLGSRRAAYELSIEVLMDLHARRPKAGHDREALAISEHSRARALLDLLAEAGADFERGGDPLLRQRRSDLLVRLAVLDGHLDRLASGSSEVRRQEGKDIAAELADVRAELDLVEAKIRRSDPRYGQLTRPEPPSVEAMQRFLSEGELLLHYALGENRSFVWAVTSNACKSFVLPPRREVEAAARRAHERFRFRPSPDSEIAEPDPGLTLSRMILGPVAGDLPKERIIVVADGALHYVPFAALPIPAGRGGPSVERLAARHEVVHLPSMTTLTALERASPGAPTVAVVADPVFDAADPRVATRGLARQRPADFGDYFTRLPATRGEAQSIAALLPEVDVFLALDFDASRARLDELSSYRIVHFATHGEIDTRDPRLSRLVLSRVDRQGRPRDGDLRLADVYDLELGAELVVLSGCATALGREVRGEGLLGLTHGFFYAGARQVVASLWNVRDRVTAELMTHFYRALLKDGLAPPAALRAAQLEISRQPDWSDPFYWAAFVIQGDWRPIRHLDTNPARSTDRGVPIAATNQGDKR